MTKQTRRRMFLVWPALLTWGLVSLLWIGSYFLVLHPTWLRESDTLWVGIGRGYVEAYYPVGLLTHYTGLHFGRVNGWQSTWAPVIQASRVAGGTCWYLGIPLWLPWMLCGLLAWCSWRVCRVPPRGCARCGYDLTGNRSGRCPECGTEIAA